MQDLFLNNSQTMKKRNTTETGTLLRCIVDDLYYEIVRILIPAVICSIGRGLRFDWDLIRLVNLPACWAV
jgi:hypothetical protein